MDNLDFSEDEIQQQLEALGYINIPKHRLREFKRDLDELIRHEKSKSRTSSSESNSPGSQNTAYRAPPAYTKVKVQQENTAAYGSWTSSQPATSDHGRLVLAPNHNRDNANFGQRQTSVYDSSAQPSIAPRSQRQACYDSSAQQSIAPRSQRQTCYDSYAQQSIAPRSQRPSTAPNRLETETELQHSSFAVSQTSTLDRDAVSQTSTPDRDADAHGRPLIKRKVLRKLKGQVQVCDESTHSEDSGALSGLEDGLGGPHGSLSADLRPADDSELESLSHGHGSEDDALSSAFHAYVQGMVRSRSENDVRSRPKSFIRPLLDHPHTRNLKKTDPVAKYFQYKQDWDMFKPPGEKDRRSLHWEIREQLAYQPPPQSRPRRVFVPNTYVVPTEKKRSALRWEVRHDLAHGLLPAAIN